MVICTLLTQGCRANSRLGAPPSTSSSLPSPPPSRFSLTVPSSSLPSLLPHPSPLPPSLPLPLEVVPLIVAKGSGKRFSSPRVWAEPGRQTVFGEFQAKNLASSSNDSQELFTEMTHQTGPWGTGWMSGNLLDFCARLRDVWGSNRSGEKC